MGLQQLSEYATAKDGPERTEAEILWQRRIILSVTPLIFCLLGTVIVLRFNRGGRGFGIAVALCVLVGFYLLTFLGEQLARVGAINVFLSGLIPFAGSLGAIVWLGLGRRVDFVTRMADRFSSVANRVSKRPERVQTRNLFMDMTTGLRDFDLIRNLVLNFSLTLVFLSSIFLIFTAFDLWKFAGTIDGGVVLLGKYLLYLLPFIYLQIAPSAAMIGTLATYVIKSRNNEIVTWTSAGQSVYRLLVPCFLLTILLGAGNWLIQEKVLPKANRLQDEKRNLIRNRGVPIEQTGKYWVANEKRIYSFEFASDNDRSNAKLTIVEGIRAAEFYESASDNEKARSDMAVGRSTLIAAGLHFAMAVPNGLAFAVMQSASDKDKSSSDCSSRCVKNLIIYEFADNGERLQAVYRADRAEWTAGRLRFIGNVERNDLATGKLRRRSFSVAKSPNP